MHDSRIQTGADLYFASVRACDVLGGSIRHHDL